jgi:hypothetical protein
MTNLQEVSQKDLLISLSHLSEETELIQDIQEKLSKIGFINLTTVSLGSLDLETCEALAMFQEVAHRSVVDAIDRSFAQKLIDITENADWPISLSQDGMVSLTKANINEARNRKLSKQHVEETVPEVEAATADAHKIPENTERTVTSANTITANDGEILRLDHKTERNKKTSKALKEPERKEFSSSEFLAWARH